jgi:opacity protein-like surface antigen
MKKSLLSLSFGGLVLWSGSAIAADFPVAPQRAPCCQAWTGFYFGAYFGAGQGNSDHTFTDTSRNTFTFTQPGVTQTFVTEERGAGTGGGDVTGSVVDLFAGYNWQVSPGFVLGAQVEGTVFSDITFKSIGTRTFTDTQIQTVTVGAVTTVTTANTSGSGVFEVTDELRSMVALVGRAGWLVTPNALLYGIGGVVFGNFVVPDSDDPFGGKRSQWEVGWTAGAGGELRLTNNWSLRGEYRYINFEFDRSRSTTDSQTTVQGLTTQTSSNSFRRDTHEELDIHLGKVGIVYTFCAC